MTEYLKLVDALLFSESCSYCGEPLGDCICHEDDPYSTGSLPPFAKPFPEIDLDGMPF